MKRKVYILSLIFILIDIIAKQLVKNLIPINTSIIIIKNFFNFTFVTNTGAAFSILRGQQLFLIILGILVLGGVVYYLRKDKLNNYKIIYYSLLMGGITGNLIDRIIYNGFIDFLYFKIFLYDAPIFNLSDSFICIGVILIILENVRSAIWKSK